jgi:hypothetical protein
MEVLTAYVRENSRWEVQEASTPTSASNENAKRVQGVEQDAEPTLRRLPTDIQTILDVLNRREEERIPKDDRVLLDLRGAFLGGATLQGATFEQAFLDGAFLQGANLQGANLQEAEELTQDQIERAIGSNETELPEGLNHPEWLSKSIEEQLKIFQERLRQEPKDE